MSNIGKKISELPTAQRIETDDFAVINNSTDGSRKILASELGGGGGGTADYVELTQAQYDALTESEKKNGKLYFITDGSGGSGGGSGRINYSTDEQDTGLKWVDGESIYQKTIYVASCNAGGSYNINHNITYFGRLISIVGQGVYSNLYLPLPYVSTSFDYAICLGNVTSTTFMIQTGGSISLTDTYVTIQYTKSTT